MTSPSQGTASDPAAATFGVRTTLDWVSVIALVTIVAASAWLRWPGFRQGGFASHDVAGILYNAMVLVDGGLPYVDTLELKAPGSFYLARVLAGGGRDIACFQIWANVWALAGLIVVAGLGWRLWGRLGAVVGAGLYALHDAHLDSMDANYVTWANLPQIAAFALGIEATRARAGRPRATWWVVAGLAAGFAALCKRPDGIVLVVLMIMAWVTAGEGARARAIAVAWVLAGFVLAHLPIAAIYLSRGALGALVDGYVLSKWGLRYLGAREGSLLAELSEGALATAHFLALPLLLAAFAGAVALAARRARVQTGDGADAGALRAADPLLDPRSRREFAFLGLWFAATLLAASLGLRFYKGYFLACAAPLCLMAAAPWGLLGRRTRPRWLARVPAWILVAGLILRQSLLLDYARADRARAHDLGGRAIAAHLLANSAADERIWVWGWHLWDVYPLTGMRSASRIYKSWGILTQPNDDTWRRGSSPARFVDSDYAAQLIADLDAQRPIYVVLGSTVPAREFRELRAFLRANYRRDPRAPRIGRVEFWRRKGG
ncbi:hypothetical protein G6O69_27860 [Pseudenhygromyxa sp. WMMC2535]|uniref:hypothetical protein n=1 Tax=Pseudenhygromyxa sp. WMMC2535 TaxID=2712867 RepID=UPI001551D691|nr:hypothetical protein [Pseudenhygromyxa sp. WMMC2535]NVB41684.1 hypothetical protein [Pseudenhygromyxa sp. WMMC2535]